MCCLAVLLWLISWVSDAVDDLSRGGGGRLGGLHRGEPASICTRIRMANCLNQLRHDEDENPVSGKRSRTSSYVVSMRADYSRKDNTFFFLLLS